MASANPGAHRRSTRYKRTQPPPFVPTPPSAEYLALSEIPSTQIQPNSDQPETRKLLVLDLNGTLVLRSPRSYNAPRAVMPRPYSKTFRKYVFREGSSLNGSHLDVMVWSSAQPHSVDSMLDAFFESDRGRLVGIWARDTLGLSSENYSQKVQTIKDLNTIWNAPAGLPPPVKIMPPPPMAILTNDPSTVPGYDPTKPPPEVKTMIYTSTQLIPDTKQDASVESDRTGYFETPEVKLDDPIPGLSAETNSGTPANILPTPPSGLYSARNTLLLDDSALKAHLQPHNHLTLPEYTTDLRARDVRRRQALDVLTQTNGDDAGEEDPEEETQPEGAAEASNAGESEQPGTADPRARFKFLRAAPFDKSLIAVIGVLAAIRYESSLVGWMRAGGMRPNAEEISRIAALFSEDPRPRREHSNQSGTAQPEDNTTLVTEGVTPVVPSKRSPADEERKESKRHRSDPTTIGFAQSAERSSQIDATIEPQQELLSMDVAATEAPLVHTTSLETPESLEQALSADHSSPSQTYGPTATLASDTLEPTIPYPHTETHPQKPAPAPAGGAKRKRHRTRQKPMFPADHPLGANDSYPFFTDGKPETKLWFEDREIYTYWVRRGILALKECGIEPEDGVE